jgi:polyisoprenoid-binding protein YceI
MVNSLVRLTLMMLPIGIVAPALRQSEPAPPTAQRWIVAPSGNEARYHVREQLASVSFPTDAVGTTSAVRGVLVLGPAGAIVRDSTRFVVDLTGLTSDRERRDHFIQRNTLETDQYPTAEFIPTAAPGLPTPILNRGRAQFQLTGDLTVHGVTRPATWQVTARFDAGEITGTASTRFTFADFGMTAPRVMIVLSVADTIGLEYDFHLIPDTTAQESSPARRK